MDETHNDTDHLAAATASHLARAEGALTFALRFIQSVDDDVIRKNLIISCRRTRARIDELLNRIE